MAWRRPGDKQLSEPMMVRLPTHICVTRPQWVNEPNWTSSTLFAYSFGFDCDTTGYCRTDRVQFRLAHYQLIRHINNRRFTMQFDESSTNIDNVHTYQLTTKSSKTFHLQILFVGNVQHYDVIKNGNIFRVTGSLWREFTDDRCVPLTKATDAELWCFLWSAPKERVEANHQDAGDLRHHRAHNDITVMKQYLTGVTTIILAQVTTLFAMCFTIKQAVSCEKYYR